MLKKTSFNVPLPAVSRATKPSMTSTFNFRKYGRASTAFVLKHGLSQIWLKSSLFKFGTAAASCNTLVISLDSKEQYEMSGEFSKISSSNLASFLLPTSVFVFNSPKFSKPKLQVITLIQVITFRKWFHTIFPVALFP